MELKRIADFLFEIGMLQHTPRTGYRFLGSGGQSVAGHLFRTALVGYLLAKVQKDTDPLKVLLMCLIHDLPESRTGDHNYVYKRYVKADEERAIRDMLDGLPLEEFKALLEEFEKGESPEAQLSRDADQIELILELKQQKDLGNPYAQIWIDYALKRIRTSTGQKVAKAILEREFCDWWFDKSKEEWWVRGK